MALFCMFIGLSNKVGQTHLHISEPELWLDQTWISSFWHISANALCPRPTVFLWARRTRKPDVVTANLHKHHILQTRGKNAAMESDKFPDSLVV